MMLEFSYCNRINELHKKRKKSQLMMRGGRHDARGVIAVRGEVGGEGGVDIKEFTVATRSS